MRVGEERMGRKGVLSADSKKSIMGRNGMMARGKIDAFKNKCYKIVHNEQIIISVEINCNSLDNTWNL